MMKEKKICLMFGAGAEQSFGLSGGENFAKIVLGITEDLCVTEMNEAIKEYYMGIDKPDWYPTYTVKPWGEKQISKAIAHVNALNGELEFKNKAELDKYVAEQTTDKSKEDGTNGDAREAIEEFFSYMGLLDVGFHTLLELKLLGPQVFWRIVSCYTRAYLLIVGEMLKDKDKELKKEDYKEILTDKAETYKKVNDWCFKQKNKLSYYSTIKELNIYDNVRVITSNYTSLCECVGKVERNHVAYVNGKIGVFESAYELRTYDMDCEEDVSTIPEDILFPYIFVQSGVKPIIEKWQLKEFSKTINFLDECSSMGIVGYGMNLDDNHINSLVRSFLMEKKKVVYFNYDGKTTEANIKRKLRVEGRDVDLEIIDTDKENGIRRFEEWLKSQK